MNRLDVRNIEFGTKVFADLNTITRESDDMGIVFTMSDEVEDRHGTIVKLDKVSLDNYRKNPIILWMHQSSAGHSQNDYNEDNVIGYGEPYFEDGKLKVRINFESEETTGNKKADKIRKKIEFGSLRMGSIGFIPSAGDFGKEDKGENPDIFYIREWELLEYSIVAIPSNPNAAVEGIKKEIEDIEIPLLIKGGLVETENIKINSPLRDRAAYRLRILKLKK